MTSPATPPRSGGSSDLVKRSAVGLVLLAILVGGLWLGWIAFWLLVSVIALFMMAEWADLHHAPPREKRLGQYALSVPLAILSPIAAGPGFLALGLVIGAAFFVVIVTGRRGLALGALYIGLPALSLLLIREQPDGIALTMWAMGLVIMTDTGAYFAGRSLGGPKLAPSISPAKTWSGLIGGVVAASIFALIVDELHGLPARLLFATPVLALLAQGGDLYESALKRRAGVKDSGTILPGHGGLLDRLDGLVPVAPAAALVLVLPLLLR